MANYRDANLLALARRQPCLLRVPGVCCADEGTTVACHSNWLEHGKGRGIKAHDFMSVWGCVACHTWLDQGGAEAEAKHSAFDAAYLRQIDAWREIASNPGARPRNVQSALQALAMAAEFFGG